VARTIVFCRLRLFSDEKGQVTNDDGPPHGTSRAKFYFLRLVVVVVGLSPIAFN